MREWTVRIASIKVISMRCRYQAAFAARTINKPRDDVVELCGDADEGVRLALAGCPDVLMERADECAALATTMLRRVFHSEQGDLDRLLKDENAAIRARRREAAGGAAVVVATVDDDVEPDLTRPSQAHGDFRVTFDAIHKEPIRRRARQLVDSALGALLLASKSEPRFDRISEAVYLLPADGGVIYSYSPSARATATVTRTMADDEVARVGTYFEQLRHGPNLDSVLGLLRAASDGRADPLIRFLDAWAGLEMFVNKVFSAYEQRWIAASTDGRAALLTAHMRRVCEVMKGKYRLLDKFTLIASVLEVAEAEADVETFKRLKRQRDVLAHEGPTRAGGPPVEPVVGLTRKYLRLHLEMARAT